MARRMSNENHAAAAFALLVTVYYWWENIKGIEESSDKALRVMQITTVMVVILMGWAFYTVFHNGSHLPPLPSRKIFTSALKRSVF